MAFALASMASNGKVVFGTAPGSAVRRRRASGYLDTVTTTTPPLPRIPRPAAAAGLRCLAAAAPASLRAPGNSDKQRNVSEGIDLLTLLHRERRTNAPVEGKKCKFY